MLHEVASALRERPDIALLEIQGYADERGDDTHNEQLSHRRAERVREWLVAHGIADSRLRVAAHGARGRIESAGDEAAHQQNRRVVFRVIEVRGSAGAPGIEATP
jgi:outer membrane protein OmpA-like peptidoglycan-associated protein